MSSGAETMLGRANQGSGRRREVVVKLWGALGVSTHPESPL